MTLVRCHACQSPLTDDGSRCSMCGRAPAQLFIDLGSTATPRAATTVVAVRGTRRFTFAAAGLAAALAIAGLAVTAGGDQQAAPSTTAEAPEPTASPAPESPTSASTTRPAATTLHPSTSAPPAVQPPATTVPYVNGRSGSVLGQTVSWRLYVVERGALTGYVEMETGRVVTIERPIPNVGGILPAANSRLFLIGSGLRTVDRNLSEEPIALRDHGYTVRSPNPGRVWWYDVANPAAGAAATKLHELDTNGGVVAQLAIPASLQPLEPFSDGFLSTGGGRIFYHDPQTKMTSTYAVGEFAMASGRSVVWRECEPRGVCRWNAGTSANPTSARIDAALDMRGEMRGALPPMLSPDGSYVLATDATGTMIVAPTNGGPSRKTTFATDYGAVWSPDSKWLLLRENGSSQNLRAVDVTSLNSVVLVVPTVVPLSTAAAALVAA